MKLPKSSKCNQVSLESEIIDNIDRTLSLNEQVIKFQEKTAIQNQLIAEQTMQIYWLIAELRGRDAEVAA